MNDEQQFRALLMLAAEPPEEMRPPVQSLLKRARRRRHLRAALSVAAAAMVVVIAIGAVAFEALTHLEGPSSPPIKIRPASLFGNVPPPTPSGPGEGQISRFRWTTLPHTPIGTRTSSTVVWADQELFQIYYGVDNAPGAAAVYRPAAGRWFRIAPPPAPASNGEAIAPTVWTGHELFVADGRSECGGSGCATFVDLYHPSTNSWTSTPEPKPMALLAPQAAVWTGRYVILAAVPPQGGGDLTVASYAPATGRWQMITPRLPRGHRCQQVAMVATFNRVILWSLWSRTGHTGQGPTGRFGVDVLATSQAGSWTNITGDWPQNHTVPDPVLTSSGILISEGLTWCGPACSAPFAVIPGYFADPVTLHRTIIPPGPLGAADPIYTWTGRTLIAFNPNDTTLGSGTGTIRQADVALYDPAATIWHSLPAPPGRPPIAAAPVWTGSELLVLTSSGVLLAFGR